MKILIIGGGVFGCNIAIELAKAKFDVDLVEQENDIMLLASMNNHNRLHLGYHYLRSIKTAEQSLEGLISFLFYYGESVYHNFDNYYAIAKEGSHTSAQEFLAFCDDVGIDYDEEYPEPELMNPNTLEASFKVPEPVFDFQLLYSLVKKNITKKNIKLKLNTRCDDVKLKDNGKYKVMLSGKEYEYDAVINATYQGINHINNSLGVKPKKINYEDVLIPLFKFNHKAFGLTIMDGPFCSVMPNGTKENHFLLYHVKESVLKRELSTSPPNWRILSNIDNKVIYKESIKYYPFLKNVDNYSSYRAIRAVHENKDDARLSELFTFEEFPKYYVVLSGKISTCVQVALSIKHSLQGKKSKKNKRI